MKTLKPVVAAAFIIPAALISAARATLPPTACSVSQAQIAAVPLETHYYEVTRRFGCEGVRVKSDRIGGLTIETYRWRGDAWPFGVFEGHFYNGIMHGTETRWLSFSVSLPG